MSKCNKIVLLLLPAVFMFIATMAQTPLSEPKPEMADLMRSNGKIYVVVAVVITILAGVFFYLVKLERKMNKLEREGQA